MFNRGRLKSAILEERLGRAETGEGGEVIINGLRADNGISAHRQIKIKRWISHRCVKLLPLGQLLRISPPDGWSVGWGELLLNFFL